MRVPLTVLDFLERAELVYGDRIGVVDEPDQPAASLGRAHLARGRRARAGPRPPASTRSASAHGERVAIVSHNSARLLTVVLRRVRLRARARADQLPAQRRRDRLHRRALAARRCCSSTPSSTTRSPASARKHRFVLGADADDELLRFDAEPEPWIARRGRDRHDQLHERHDRAPEGRAAHPPQPLAQRDDVRLADRRERPRRVPAHAADVPLQRLGHAVRGHRHGRPPRRAAQGRRRRDPAPRRASTASRCCAARPRSSPRSSTPRATWDGPIPGRGRVAHRRRRRAAADPHDRADRDRARLGVHPDLRAHRDRRRCSR